MCWEMLRLPYKAAKKKKKKEKKEKEGVGRWFGKKMGKHNLLCVWYLD